MAGINEMRDERKAKAKELRNLVDTNTGDKWTPEIDAQYNGLVTEIDRLDQGIERYQKVLDVEAQNLSNLAQRADERGLSVDEVQNIQNQETAIMVQWLRGGHNALTPEQAQALNHRTSRYMQGVQNLGVTIPTEGGFLAPDLVGDRILVAMKAYGGMRQSGAQILSTSNGNTIPWPTTDPTGEQGEIVGENNLVTIDDTIKFGQVNIGAYMYSSKAVAVPMQLLQDSAYPIEAHIIDRLGMRIGRITNSHFTSGDGNAKPRGLITASTLGKAGPTGQSTSCKWDDLVDLEHSIDPAYRQSGTCKYMFNDTTLRNLKKLKDGQGRPLWLPGVESREPNTVNTYEYIINQDVAVMAASAKSILFGRFDYYVIRDVSGIMLFRMTDSVYTTKAQVGFLSLSRHDGNLIAANGDAVRYYQNSAT